MALRARKVSGGFRETVFRSPFLQGPEKFSHPESRSISNLMTSELSYAHTSPYEKALRASSTRDLGTRLGPNGFRGFQETGPRYYVFGRYTYICVFVIP